MIWHWDVIKEIQKRHLQRRFGRPRLKHVQFLCVDEISIGKGHRSGLLAYYDYPLSSGPLEGTNNNINTVKRQDSLDPPSGGGEEVAAPCEC